MRAYDAYAELEFFVYVCRKGDEIGDIAERFDMIESDIAELNGDTDNLRCGDEIIIKRRKGRKYRVRGGDTLDGIAEKFGEDKRKIMENNGIDRIYPAQILFI